MIGRKNSRGEIFHAYSGTNATGLKKTHDRRFIVAIMRIFVSRLPGLVVAPFGAV